MRIDKVDGDVLKFRAWMFEFLVCMGRLNVKLATKIQTLVGKVERKEVEK